MRGVELFQSMKMFGARDGFTFWFNWTITTPIQQFVWLNITHRSYCTFCGWGCLGENCEHKKLTTKTEILEHWEKMQKEITTVEKGKGGLCVYCGDEKGTETIPNPNFSELTQWLVCKDCKEVLHHQLSYTMAEHFGDEKKSSEAIDKLDEIAKKTGKPIMIAQIRKTKSGYEPSSITFTGEKE